jgi:hypothetical protein
MACGVWGRLYESFSLTNKLTSTSKSTAAYLYASRSYHLNHDNQKNSKRYTFWVNANTLDTLKFDYQRIAESVNVQGYDKVKAWLEGYCHRWLLVIDGLDSIRTLHEINKFLPANGSGRILFTTRNREVLVERETVEKMHCHHLDQLDEETARTIFNRHFHNQISGNQGPYVDRILRRLKSPLLLSWAAKDFSDNPNYTIAFCNDLETSLIDTIDELRERSGYGLNSSLKCFELVVSPLPTTSDYLLRLFCTLACFGADYLASDLIERYDKNPRHLHKELEKLEHYSFIVEDLDESGKITYRMPELIRESAIEWLRVKGRVSLFSRRRRRTRDQVAILLCFQRALVMLSKHYAKEISSLTYQHRTGSSSPTLDSPFLRYLERFCLHVRARDHRSLHETAKKRRNINVLSNETVRLIVTACYVYCAKHKTKQAIDVLKATRRLYPHGRHQNMLALNLFNAHVLHLKEIQKQLLQSCKATGPDYERLKSYKDARSRGRLGSWIRHSLYISILVFLCLYCGGRIGWIDRTNPQPPLMIEAYNKLHEAGVIKQDFQANIGE